MTIAAPAKTSVLAKLTASVMEEKRTASRTLTPVAGEEKPPLAFPSDLPGSFMSHEGMRESAKDIRRHAASLIVIADAIDALSGFDTVEGGRVGRSAAEIQKEKEREADERVKAKAVADVPEESAQPAPEESFADRQARLSEEAKASFFKWACPDHGKAVRKVSGKGREYIGCPDCNQFERV